VLVDHGGDRRRVLGRRHHADLDRNDRHVGQHDAGLPGDPFGGDRLHAGNAGRVLRGDRGNDRKRMAAHRGERQQVGLQTGAAARVGAGKREHDGWQRAGARHVGRSASSRGGNVLATTLPAR